MQIQKILLTSDLSEESKRAFGPVAALARDTGAAVVLLHVVEDVPIAPHGAPLAPPMHAPDLQDIVAAAKQKLESLKKELGAGLKVDAQVVTSTSPAEAIARFAKDQGCSLIALSTHGRTGFRRLVLGSVAEHVVRHAHVPVLVLPRPE